MNPNHLNAYEVLKEEDLQDIHSKGWLLKHKKTGARVMLIENSNENKVFNIAFRTPPKNSTGVAHILEHSVLCGSREFPLKDPFVELVKGSLNTFLNAMTYPDKTCYGQNSRTCSECFERCGDYSQRSVEGIACRRIDTYSGCSGQGSEDAWHGTIQGYQSG